MNIEEFVKLEAYKRHFRDQLLNELISDIKLLKPAPEDTPRNAGQGVVYECENDGHQIAINQILLILKKKA